MQDEQLVHRILAGDDAAFTTMMEIYQKRVYSVAYGIVRNPDDAMDVAQETFFRAWARISSWRGEASLSTWLCRIASNLALDIVRKNKRVIPVDEIAGSQVSADADAVTALISAENTAELEKAVAELSEDYRSIIVMRHTAAMSYQDIADALGLSLSQVKNRLLRARQMLKTKLTGRVD